MQERSFKESVNMKIKENETREINSQYYVARANFRFEDFASFCNKMPLRCDWLFDL